MTTENDEGNEYVTKGELEEMISRIISAGNPKKDDDDDDDDDDAPNGSASSLSLREIEDSMERIVSKAVKSLKAAAPAPKKVAPKKDDDETPPPKKDDDETPPTPPGKRRISERFWG